MVSGMNGVQWPGVSSVPFKLGLPLFQAFSMAFSVLAQRS